MRGERPPLVFPLSSGEIVEGFGDDEDRDGASEAGLEENAADVTPLEARPRSQVIRIALESLDEVDLRTLFRVDLQGTKCCWRGVGSDSSSSRGCSFTDHLEEG